jgi:hypothetical protein
VARALKKAKHLSRTALELFTRCQHCFYLQRALNVPQPPSIPLTLAVATDALLKSEFDAVRETGAAHPVWKREGLRVRAYNHSDIENWRDFRKGIRFTHSSGTDVYGAVDDVWENLDTGQLHIVDYKSTSKKGDPSIEDGWGPGYKRQMEIYQWLFRQSGHSIDSTGYFLYVNGSKEGRFYENGTDGVMRFRTTIIPYTGDDSWVADTVDAAIACLNSTRIPPVNDNCDICKYFVSRQSAL